jgi:BirA family biotin operon repressor/biotin-[acetyl-CoA-carboxylase] ligase
LPATGPGEVTPPAFSFPLDPRAIRRRLDAAGADWRLICLRETGSTNDVCRAAGERGIGGRLAVFAELQTAGRGRAGRRWSVPSGLGLMSSTLWRPNVDAARAATLSQVAGLAVVDALEAAGVHARLKWPNDVLVGGAKAAGILLEGASLDGRPGFVVIGIGINVNQSADDLPATPYPATSLRLAAGRILDRADLAAALLRALGRLYDGWLADPRSTYLRWRDALDTLGREVVVLDGDSAESGRAIDVEPDGTLLLETSDGRTERLVSGEVSVRVTGDRPGDALAGDAADSQSHPG